MSEAAAESSSDSSSPLSDAQFGDFQTAQDPGDGIGMYGFYPDRTRYMSPLGLAPRPAKRKKRKHRK